MGRIEFLLFFASFAGVMFALGWVGAKLHVKLFQSSMNDEDKALKGFNTYLSQIELERDQARHELEETKAMLENDIEGLKEENSQYLERMRYLQDRVYQLEQGQQR